ncbi:hypothetical protein HDU87_002396 [Geranomyces variabilis]|uniref:WHIM2 domain-containing protein n=1 Tax=Geranomyces variabilis TaxID=109894 RepID=A0AAD5XN88_9FUNG|nr:hypothetical protein HDU87_002396 [Geranomyces variabilis]
MMDRPVHATLNDKASTIPEKRKACEVEDTEAHKSARNSIVDDVKVKLAVRAEECEVKPAVGDSGSRLPSSLHGATSPQKASPSPAKPAPAPKSKQKARGSTIRSTKPADGKTQTMLNFLYGTGKPAASNGVELAESNNSKSPAESTISTPSTMVSPSRPTSSRGSSRKPSPSPKGSPKSSSSKSKSSLKQAPLAFPAATAPVKSSATKRAVGTPTKTKLELMYPIGPVLGKKPTKIMDDLAPEMYPHAKPLPKFKDAPADGKHLGDGWRALAMRESLDLAAVAEFCTQYAEFLDRHDTEVKLTFGLLEDYISDGNKHFDPLTSIYRCLYRSLEPEIAVSKDSVQHRVAQHLLRSDSADRRHAGALFTNGEFASIPPPVHARVLHHLVNGVIERPEFHQEVRAATDRLQDMRTDKWASSNRKKALQEEHEELEAKLKEKQDAIDAIDIEIEALRAAAAAASDDEDSEDAFQPAGKQRRGRAMQRLVSRDNQERKAKELKAKRMQQAAMVRDHTLMLNKLSSAEKTYDKACEDERTWDARYAALDRMIRVGRGSCLGQDRYGRMYWWLEVREPRAVISPPQENEAIGDTISENGQKMDVDDETSPPISDDEQTKTQPKPALVGGVYGVVVEAIAYSYHGVDEPLDDKGKGPAKEAGETDYYTPPNNETKRNMIVKIDSQFWYLEALSTALKLYRACNEKGARERDLRSRLKPCLERVGVRPSAGVAGARLALEATQAFSQFNAWVAARRARITPPAAAVRAANVADAVEANDRRRLDALALSVQSFGNMWFKAQGDEIPPGASLDDIKAAITCWAVAWNDERRKANGALNGGAPSDAKSDEKAADEPSDEQSEELLTLPSWIETVEIVAGAYAWCEDALVIFEKLAAERAEVEAAEARKRKKAGSRGAAAAAAKSAIPAKLRSESPSVTSSVRSVSPPPPPPAAPAAGRGSRANNELRALQSAAAAIIALPTEYKARRHSEDRLEPYEPENHDPGVRTRSGRRVHKRETAEFSDAEFDDILGDDDESVTARRKKGIEKRKPAAAAAPISTRLRTRATRNQAAVVSDSESDGREGSGSEEEEAAESSEEEDEEEEEEDDEDANVEAGSDEEE